MVSDRELLVSWSRGDRRAGNRLFQRHFDAIYRFFAAKVRGGVDDLIQRTFLALSERAASLPADIEVRPYLFGDPAASFSGYEPIGLPFAAGYTIGFHLIQSYLARTGRTIVGATYTPAADIIANSGYFA